MDSIICTLFENDFEYGVGSFVNSLYNNGFRGDIVIGYRRKLPDLTP
jgi:hypothetical protein